MTGSRGRTDIHFEADKQTWKDLDLFDQGGRGLLFSLFNKTKTKGGAEALERILKAPCNERPVLEARREMIRFFRERNIDLQIGRKVVDVEYYLNSTVPIFPGNRLDAGMYHIRNQFKESPRYYTVTWGVKNTVSLLRHLFELISDWRRRGCPETLVEVLAEMSSLITEKRVRALLMEMSGPLGWRDFARCDDFFRRSGKGAMRRLLDLVYEWDACVAVAKTAEQCDMCFPQYSEDREPVIRAEGLFHPLVANAVANDYSIGAAASLCFISGANMAGKSTFLKSLGVAVYLAHVGFPVPARVFETTIFNGVMTTVNLADSISQGYSHFYAEVRRVREVAAKIREKHRVVVIIDELFRGTNVKDATDASLAVIDALAGIPGSLFVVSTHIVEIAAGLQDHPNIFFSCFSATMEGGVPWYRYKLREGVSDERAGMTILRNEGILEMLAELRGRGK